MGLRRLLLSSLVVAVASTVPAHAQVEIHRVLTVEDGLVQSQVNAIHEDRHGYVWFGTFAGISRWDGRTFRNFQIEDGLAGLDIRAIHETKDGRLLIGTADDGISIYRDGEFVTLDVERGFPSNSIRVFLRAVDGSLLVATNNGVVVFPDESLDMATADLLLTGRSVSGIIPCGGDGFYVSTFGDGVFKWTDGGAEPIDPKDELPGRIIRAIHEAPDGILFISVYKGGVWLLENGQFRPFQHNAELAGHDVKMFIPASDGTLYLPTIEGGVARYGPDDRFDILRTENGLADLTSWCVHEGRSGVIYIGTWGGVNLYRPGRIKTLNQDSGLPGNIVGAVAQDHDGTFYVGTIGNGLVEYTDGVRRTITRADGLAHDRVWSLEAARDGTLYIGTHAGVNTLRNGRLRTLFHEPVEPMGRVYGIEEARDGTVYFATYGGIHLYRNGVVEPLYDEPHSGRSSVYAVCEGRSGEVYFGTREGIIISREGSVEIPQTPATLARAHVWSIHESSEGALYFGTNGLGLLRMRNGFASGGHIDTLDVSDGLSDNTVFGILEDEEGRLYLSTHRGVNVVDLSTEDPSVRHIRYSDGLASDECNQGAAFKDSHGRLWFGTIRGASCYDPRQDRPNPTPPNVQFTRIRMFEDDLAVSDFTPPAVFEHNENYLRFDFVGTNPTAPDRVLYQYRMSHIDRGWVGTEHNFVQYRALPHNDYTFEVKACNEWGHWSDPVGLSFEIKPPFWKTWWFILLVILAIGGAIALLVLNRVRHLLAIERLRTKIAADLHDDVGAGLTEISIMGEVIRQKLPEASRSLVAAELGRIGDASRQLIDGMSDIVWLVNPKRDSLHDLIARLGDSYKETLNAAGVTLSVHNVDRLKHVRLGMDRRQHVLLIFKEAINNAIKYSDCTEITLEVDLKGNQLTMQLCDNGCGFDTNAPAPGNGLQNMRERAARIGAEVEIISSPGNGTKVTFRGAIR